MACLRSSYSRRPGLLTGKGPERCASAGSAGRFSRNCWYSWAMQRKPVLGDLEGVFQRQLLKLRWDVQLSQRCDTSRERERTISFAVISLLNAWTNFVRAFYLSCVFGARTKSAVRVRPSSVFPDANAAIGFAIRLFRPYASPNTFGQWHRRDEPVWHDPTTLLRLSANLGL